MLEVLTQDRQLDAEVAEKLMGHALVGAEIAEQHGSITLSNGGEIGDGGVLPYRYRDGDAQFITRYPDDPVRAHVYEVPFYSSDIAAAMQVEDRIAELNLQNDYIAHLWDKVGAKRNGSNFWTADNMKAFWLCIHASPEQRCQAALAALKDQRQ